MALYRLIQLLLFRSCKNIHLLHNHSNTINQSTIIYLSLKRKYIPIGTNATFSYFSAERCYTERRTDRVTEKLELIEKYKDRAKHRKTDNRHTERQTDKQNITADK